MKKKLIDFEQEIADLFKQGRIRCPVHLSGGNEKQLIDIFKDISPDDYVFSHNRNHYHYLLHTNDFEGLKNKILNGDSMHTCNPEKHFYSSSILSGCVAIACGVALALKMKGSKQKVWCFIGDGASDEGFFYEAWRYALSQELPLTFIIEDNDRSVCTTKRQRWGNDRFMGYIKNQPKIIYYEYRCFWPHCGIGEFVNLEGNDI